MLLSIYIFYTYYYTYHFEYLYLVGLGIEHCLFICLTSSKKGVYMKKTATMSMTTILCFLFGCVSTKYLCIHQDPGFDLEELKKQKIRVYTSGNAQSTTWPKSFTRTFNDNQGCSKFTANQLTWALTSLGFSAQFDSIESNAQILRENANEEEIATFLANIEEKFVINIRNVLLEKSFHFSPGAWLPTAGGSSMKVGGGSKTECQAKIVIDVYNTETAAKVPSYETIDQATVKLFMFGTAMKQAIQYSAQGAAKYLLGVK